MMDMVGFSLMSYISIHSCVCGSLDALHEKSYTSFFFLVSLSKSEEAYIDFRFWCQVVQGKLLILSA